MFIPNLNISLPKWIHDFLSAEEIILPNIEDRMRLAVKLSELNITEKTGGPFGAAVFDDKGILIAPGVNLVESSQCSILHAEMVAIALAQKTLNRFDLSDGGKSKYELITTTEPCAMCYGAIPWSGVSRLVCGARDEDARAIGFDEGAKLKNWKEELQKRNIEVRCDCLREEAKSVLKKYSLIGGKIYNSGKYS
ncbi:MAG: tRNA-specific adenosine deaminase [Planctomycetes bacterium GWF2_42_9]|nr:MAG: tRNA-specific adenosine deaminase [Planctomycetes bacterium GWF2_42_9]HAL46027.1 tRNA-specific adenosine deaminase [Phycisphaerales bacterium]